MKDYEQAAEYLGVTVRFMRRLVAERRVRFVKLGGRLVRFRDADLDAFVAESLVEPATNPALQLLGQAADRATALRSRSQRAP